MTVPTNTVFVQGQGTISDDQLNSLIQGALTVQSLRAFIGLSTMQVSITGISTPNDGGAGMFYWNATATGTDDNYSFIVPQPGLAGAWIRLSSLAVQINFYAIDSGTVNALVATYNPAITSYTDGQILYVRPANGNTDATTFNGGAGALPVVGPSGALQGGEIIEGYTLGLQYSALNNNFEIISGWGSQQGLPATQEDQYATLGQIGTGYAPAGGNIDQTFIAADGTIGNEVVNISQFPNTVGSPGSLTIPGVNGNIIFQWGTFSAQQNGGGTVTFPTAFPTACFVVILTAGGTGTTNSTLATSSVAPNEFGWGWPATASNTETVYYFAIGH